MKRLSCLMIAVLVVLSACSPAPAFTKYTTTQVLDAFKAAKLEIGDSHLMTKEDYGVSPLLAVEGTRFLIPSLGPDNGGHIFSFSNQDDLQKEKAYYESLPKISAILFSWIYIKDNILVQINGKLPEETAKQYEAVLNTLK